MATVPQPDRARNCAAFRATLDTTEGIAMRDTTDRVFFIDDQVGLWRELFNADMPRLGLNGKLDLIQVQAILDGDLAHLATHRANREV
jgi:hypothetical protein